MKRINWGTGIFLFYSFFAATLFYQVYKSTQYDNSLVVDDYYAKDLSYQQTIDKLKNSAALVSPLKINYYDILQLVELEFPDEFENITGTIQFYRAANKKEDVLLPIELGGNKCMDVFIRSLKPGLWKIEVDWVGDGTPFLDRQMIIVPDYVPDKLLTELVD